MPAPIVAACVASSEKSSGVSVWTRRASSPTCSESNGRFSIADMKRFPGSVLSSSSFAPDGVKAPRAFDARSSSIRLVQNRRAGLTRIKPAAAGPSISARRRHRQNGKGRYNGARRSGAGVAASALRSSRGQVTEPADTQEAVFRFLADPRTHGLSGPVRRVDTAGAVVFLAGPDAYKVKRAVRFPFMDLFDAREAARGLRGGNRRQSGQCAERLSRSAADRSQRRGLRDRGRGRNRRMGRRTCAASTRTATLDRVAEREGVSDAIIDKLALAIRRSHARAPLARRRAGGARARDLYRAERRRIRRMARLCSRRRTPAASRQDSRLALRHREARAAGARRFRIRPPVSRGSCIFATSR